MDTQNDALEKVIPLHILPFFGDPCYISEGYSTCFIAHLHFCWPAYKIRSASCDCSLEMQHLWPEIQHRHRAEITDLLLVLSEIPRPTTVWMVMKKPCKSWDKLPINCLSLKLVNAGYLNPINRISNERWSFCCFWSVDCSRSVV